MKTILLFLFTLALPVMAELPQSAYLTMKKAAPEIVEIRVDKAKRGNWFSPGEVVTATVLKITKTTRNLKIGDTIKIRYRHIKLPRGAAGPSPIPRLTKKLSYTAWLRKSKKGYYEPAARGMSFQRLAQKED